MNILPIVLAIVFAQVVGFIWYGPLFGKQWMKIMGMDCDVTDKEAIKKAQKGMGKVYFANTVLCIMLYVTIAIVIGSFDAMNAVQSMWVAVLVWLGIIVPMQGQVVLFSNKPKQLGWSMFFINCSYQLICAIAVGLLVGAWM